MKRTKLSNLRVGADPEVFLRDELGFVSAHGFFPGTKSEPYKVEKGAVQVDGLALEFNIDPASTPEEFDDNIRIVLAQMEEMVKEVNPDWQIDITPFARFDTVFFEALVPDEAKILGCEPDYDLKGNMKTPNEDLQFRPVRTAAGHAHIGWLPPEEFESVPFSPAHLADCRFIAQRFTGMRHFFPQTEAEINRVQFYGNRGSHRPKVYGVELRSPSNLWIKSSVERRRMFMNIYNTMRPMMEI